MAQFCFFTLALTAIFGLFSFILMYTLEDSFIEREVLKEAKRLEQIHQQTNEWVKPKHDYISLHQTIETLPHSVKSKLLEEPKRREFYGEQQRHYHLFKYKEQKVWLLAEVSELLLVRPMRDGLITFFVIAGLILSILAVLVAWLLARKTAKPLKELAELVDGVAPENLPKQFANRFPNNEIGILAKTLEDTMARIEQAMVREKHFTRDVSHELRTPIAIIKNAVEVFNNNKHDNELAESIVKRIGESALKAEQSVTTLLMLAREEQSTAEKQPTKLLSVVEQAVIDHSYLLLNKDIEVVVDDSCQQEVIAIQGMLKVLLDNLISNAFQYTDKGQVTISYSKNQLVVADSGPGIEADIANNVTESAVKGSQSTGYGFGLSIVKRLCEHQRWQLNVSSNNTGTDIAVKIG